jgi:hypothetical protein
MSAAATVSVKATAAPATDTFVWPGTEATVMSAMRRTPFEVDGQRWVDQLAATLVKL